MTWTTWRRHFETNATRPVPAIDAPVLSDARRVALASSVARFQLGESGEGRIAHEIDSAQLPGVDDDYRVSLKRFVAEEGRHARLLGRMVNVLGGKMLHRQWSDAAFVGIRRALGLRFKLLVLMAAEVIGISFYGVLGRLLPDGSFKRALEQICGDEERHLEFHVDFFRSQRPQPLAWVALWLAWWPVAIGALTVVLIDHRSTLRAFGVPLHHVAAVMWARVKQGGQFLAPARVVSAVHPVR